MLQNKEGAQLTWRVSMQQMRQAWRRARVTATFIRLLSDKKPTSPEALLRTVLMMIASFSRP